MVKLIQDVKKNTLKQLAKAVKSRRCVAIRYRDQKEIRVIEPHCIYTNDQGEFIIDGFQTRGHSHSGRPPPFWRPFRLKKISAVSLMEERFEVRRAEGFDSNKSKYKDRVIAIVADTGPSHLYPEQDLQEMGPFLPKGQNR